ncbi:MAG: hypothetical protein P1U87_14965 [Verrucomicrobiales bacterium]|nr:hypothetical protein [Verrucomicrobiales bacterium]
MSTLEAAFGQLPEPILNKLDSMIRRIRRLLFLRGLFATLAVGLACLLAIMAIDATITLFSSTARWILSLTGLAITGVAAWWFLFRPLSRRFTLTHMARILEIRHPELQERISTAVELLSSNDPDSIRGSEELIEAVVDSAVEDVELVDPKTEFKPAKSNKFALAAVVLASIVALTLVIWPKQSWTLITRALAPYLDIGNAYADSLVIKPGDIRIARGDSVSIEMSIQHKRLRRAEIRRLLADGTESVERMTLIGEEQDGTKRFSLTFPNVEESFDYRVRAGSALSRYFKVETVLPPSVDSLALRYDYPDYTGLATSVSSTQTGEIRAVNHTAVSVTATVNKPVQTSKLIINSATELPAPDVEGNQLTWYFEMKSGMNGSWHLELADVDGFSNAPVSYPLEVLPDKAPTVQLTQPTLRELSLKPTESLQITADVIEDYGFGDAALVITPEGATDSIEQMQPSPVSMQGPGAYQAKAVLNLPALHLRPEQKRLAVQLRVRDNRPGDYDGPGVGFSETIFINVSKSAKSLADQAIEKQRKEVRENLEEAKRELQRARDEMRRAEQELSRSDEVSQQARERLEEFSERTESARNKLDEVAAALNQSLFQEQADKARELANETIAEAREKADLVPVTDGKKERIKEANQARQKVEEAMREIDKLARSMQDAEEDYETISKLNELANRQQELAMKAEEMADSQQQQAQQQAQNQQQQKQMNQFQAEQNQLQQQLGQMLKDNAAALNEILEGQQEEAQQMSQEAAALAQEQNELKKLSEDALKADEAKQEALKKELLDRLKEEQTQLAQEATQRAAQEAADEATAKESPQGESSESEPDTPGEMARNDPAEQTAGEKGDSATQPQSSPDSPGDPAPDEAAGENTRASETPSAQSPAEQLAEAAEQATRAAEQLGKEDLAAASEAASEASDTLAEAAAQSPGDAMPQDNASEAGGDETGPAEPAGQEGEEMASTEAAGNEASPAGEPSAPAGAQAEAGQEGAEPDQAPASSAELAERQEALAEQIEAVKNGDLQLALSLMEEQLSAEADSLQAEAQAFEEALKNLSQRSAQSGADRAEQALNRGSQKAGDASKQLADAQKQQSQAEEQGRVEQGELSSDAQSTMQRSQSEQGQSENFLNQAAQALGQTSESIGKTMDGLEPSDMDDRIADSKDLANGFEEMAESSQAQNAQQAAQESQEAANAMKQIAQAAMSKLGNPGNTPPGDPSQQNQQMPQDLTGDPTSENLNETGQKTADGNGSGVPPELERLGISVEDWARFRGALVGGNATAIETELPAEYRELVGRYFQVIAKEAGKDK